MVTLNFHCCFNVISPSLFRLFRSWVVNILAFGNFYFIWCALPLNRLIFHWLSSFIYLLQLLFIDIYSFICSTLCRNSELVLRLRDVSLSNGHFQWFSVATEMTPQQWRKKNIWSINLSLSKKNKGQRMQHKGFSLSLMCLFVVVSWPLPLSLRLYFS